jgi:hypothetical protein
VGADDGATQSNSEFNNDSASDESGDSDAASRLSFETVRPRRPTVEKSERVIEEDTPARAPAATAGQRASASDRIRGATDPSYFHVPETLE